MAVNYQRTSDFTTEEPEELRRDLQTLDRLVSDTARATEVPALTSTVRRVSTGTAARFGETLLVDTGTASVTVRLPLASANKSSAGRMIAVLRKSLSNSLTISPTPPDLINKATSYVVAASYGPFLVLFDGSGYWVR